MCVKEIMVMYKILGIRLILVCLTIIRKLDDDGISVFKILIYNCWLRFLGFYN